MIESVLTDSNIQRYAVSLAGDTDTANDLISEAITSILERQDKLTHVLSDRKKFYSYFAVTLKNLNLLRIKNKTLSDKHDAKWVQTVTETPGFNIDIDRELEKLPFYQREMLKMYKTNTLQEISEKTKIPYVSVQKDIAYAKKQLKQVADPKFKLLVITPNPSAVTYYRLIMPLCKMKREYEIEVTFVVNNDDKVWQTDCTHVLFNRNISAYNRPELLIKKFRDKGVKVICDIDDYWDVPKPHPLYGNYKKYNLPQCYMANVHYADVVWASTRTLAKHCLELNKNVHVVKNAIDPDEKQFKRDYTLRTNSVMWAGGTSHERDMNIVKGLDAEVNLHLYGITEEHWAHGMFPNATMHPAQAVWEYAPAYNNHSISIAPLLNNRFNQSKCIVGSSLISTRNGIYRINQLVSEEVSTKTEVCGRENTIINHFKYEDRSTIKITTKDGYTIEGTPHHRIMVNGEWKELSLFSLKDTIDLTIPNILQKDYQYISFPMLLTKNVTDEKIELADEDMIPRIKVNENWGRLFGYILGDGSVTGSVVRVSCDKRHVDVVEDVTSLFTSIGLNPHHYEKKPDKRNKTSIVKEGFGLDVVSTCVNFRKILNKYGAYIDGKKQFCVPDFIFKSPESVIRQFIKGLFEADGTVSEQNGVRFTTKSKQLAEEVQYLLLCMGMQSSIKSPYNKQYKRHYYTVALNRYASEVYKEKIGFVSRYKIEKLDKLTTGRRSNASKPMSFTDTVKKIEYGNNTVYDIEVESVHMYNANGICNHNSELKIIEAGHFEQAIIVSNVTPYKGLIHGQNGYIAENSQWSGFVKRLSKDPARQEDMGKELGVWVRNKFDLAHENRIRFQTL